MKKNPGRKQRREKLFKAMRKKGDTNRNSQHKMKTHDGMRKKVVA